MVAMPILRPKLRETKPRKIKPRSRWLSWAVGEASKLKDALSGSSVSRGGSYSQPYKLDSTWTDRAKARALYNNTDDSYKLGAGFAKPVINTAVGFMGVPRFRTEDEDAQAVLDDFFGANVSKEQATHRDALRDGDAYVWVTREELEEAVLYPETKTRLVYNIIPAEQVKEIVRDPVTRAIREYVLYSEHTWSDEAGNSRRAKVLQRISAQRRLIKIEGDVPPDVKVGEEANPWGFIPIVHFKNEGDETTEFGRSDLEPIEPFMKAYHDVMLHAIQGSKLHSTPRLKIKLKDVSKFLANNFGITDPAKWTEAGNTISLDGHELLIFQDEEDAQFIEVSSAIGAAEPLLKLLFYCLVDTSETPEFVFGTHTPSSLASVKEQMPILIRRISRKREHFTEAWQKVARIVLAMTANAENRQFSTYATTLEWDDIDPRDGRSMAEELSFVAQALNTALQGGFVSLDAAVQFLARYIETMNDYVSDDPEIPGERERIIKTRILLARLEDGALVDEEKQLLDRELGAGGGAAGERTADGRAAKESKGKTAGEMDPAVDDLEGAQDPFVYLIHHIHHVATKGKTAVREELHHCPLFVSRDADDAEGDHYMVDDMRVNDRVFHVLVFGTGQADPGDTLYDHLGNAYRIVRKQIGGEEKWVVAGLKRGQKVKWSDAEAA